MKVKDKFNIDEFLLENLASKEKGSYFSKSLAFYNDMKNKDAGKLTAKQDAWLNTLSNILEQKSSKIKSPVKTGYKKKEKPKFAFFPKKVNGKWVWFSFY